MINYSLLCLIFIDIPVYGVLTGRDKHKPTYNDKACKVSKKVTTFCQILGLPKHRFAYITNYCDESDPSLKYLNTTIPQFDVPVLRFLKQVIIKKKLEFPVNTRHDNSYCGVYL